MLAVYTLVFQLLLPNRSPSTSPYALFLFCGLLPWNWLSSSITDGASSLLTHGALLRKILFPAEVLPAVAVFAQGVHFLLALPVLLAALLAGAFGAFGSRVPLGWSLVQVPFLMLLQAVLLLGIGLFLAALTVHFRDVKDLLQTILSRPLLRDADPLHPEGPPEGEGDRSPRAESPRAPLLRLARRALLRAGSRRRRRGRPPRGSRSSSFAIGWAFFDRLRDSFPEAV